jgi:phenylpropionate dioxygenase-like ring-hydroxylating dioxygenase large terminal subunit
MTTSHVRGLTEAEAAGIQSFEKPDPGSWTEAFGLKTGPVSFKDSYDPEFYELEKEAVFRRSWLHIGRVEQLPRKGTYFTKELEFLKISALIIRGMDDEIRAFHNVCSHRGNKLMWDDYPSKESSGSCRQIACKYHGWRFDLEGQINYVHNAPEFFDLKEEELALPKINLEVWAGFIFINLEDTPRQSLREFLGPDVVKLESYPFDQLTHQVVLESDINANWKLYMDAFQELYHVPYVHGKMNNPGAPTTGIDKVPFMVPGFSVHGKHRCMTSGGPLANAKVRSGLPLNDVFRSNGFFGPEDVPDIGPLGDAINPSGVKNWGLDSWQIYPNLVILTWNRNWVSTYQYWPQGPDAHTFEYTMSFPEPTNVGEWLAKHYTWVGNKEFATQDANTLEATQSMIRTGARDKFQLCDQEVMVRHLHEVVQADVEAYQREIAGKLREDDR